MWKWYRMMGVLPLAWAAAAVAAAAALAAEASADAFSSVGAGAAGSELATAEISVTVPRKTTSSDWRPGHFPGGSLEQVQASKAEGMKIARARMRRAR